MRQTIIVVEKETFVMTKKKKEIKKRTQARVFISVGRFLAVIVRETQREVERRSEKRT